MCPAVCAVLLLLTMFFRFFHNDVRSHELHPNSPWSSRCRLGPSSISFATNPCHFNYPESQRRTAVRPPLLRRVKIGREVKMVYQL